MLYLKTKHPILNRNVEKRETSTH